MRSIGWLVAGVSLLCGCVRGAALDRMDGGAGRAPSSGTAIASDGGHPTSATDAGGPAPGAPGPAPDAGHPTDASGSSPDAAGPATDAGHPTDAGVPMPASCPIGVGRGSATAPPPPAYVRACDGGLTAAASYTLVPDRTQTAYHRCGTLGEVASSVSISPDGRRLAVVAAESVRLFDTATWREVARVAHAVEPVDAAALSPNNRHLATVASYIGQLTLWDSLGGFVWSLFPGTVASPGTSQLARGSGIAFSSDGRLIATSMGTIIDTQAWSAVDGANGQIRNGRNRDLWFTPDDTGVLARTMYHSGDSWGGVLIERFDAVTGALQAGVGDSVALSGDRTQAVGVIDQWSQSYSVVGIGLPTPVTELMLPLSAVPGVYWSRTDPVALDNRGDLLALADGSTELRIVETQQPNQEVARIPFPAETTVVGVSPGDELVTSGPCGTIAWDWRSGEARWAQPFTVRTIAWSPDGSLALATGLDALFRVWRVDTGAEVCAPPGGHAVTDRVFSTDGSAVLVRYDDGAIEVRRGDLTDTQPVARSAVGTGLPVALSNDASAVAIWADLPQTQPPAAGQAPPHRLEIRRIDGSLVGAGPIDPSYRPYGAALSPDLTRALFGSNVGTLLIDVQRGTTIASWNSGATVISFSPDGARFALTAPDGIATFSSLDGSAGPVMRPTGQAVSGGRLSGDWSVAVADLPYTASPDNEHAIRWQTPDGPAQTIPADNLGPAVLSADGSLIIRTQLVWHEFTGDYYDVIVRDTATGALVQRFYDHPVTPSADGKRLFGYGGAVFCR